MRLMFSIKTPLIIQSVTSKLFHSDKIRNALLVISLLLLWQFSHGQKLNVKIDSILSKHFAKNNPGAAVLVSQGDKILYRSAIGMADLELGIKLTPDMKFYIGSNTKQFTAVSILLLAQKGKISLSDNLCKYFPDFSANCEEITIHHLLNHSSGIYDYTSDDLILSSFGHDITKEQMLTKIKSGSTTSRPGDVYSYNNSGYYLLGLIIEKIANVTYAEFLSANIFMPLGMMDSQYGDYRSIIERRVKGYDQRGQSFTNAAYWDLNQVYSAGGIISSVDDLMKWRNALNEGKLLNKKYLQLAQTNHKLNNNMFSNYGYGFDLRELAGKNAIGHAGGFSGFYSYATYLTESGIYIVVLSNCWWTDQKVSETLIDIAKIVTK